jgi:hypothetical protein
MCLQFTVLTSGSLETLSANAAIPVPWCGWNNGSNVCRIHVSMFSKRYLAVLPSQPSLLTEGVFQLQACACSSHQANATACTSMDIVYSASFQ